MTRVFLIRHGETDANRLGLIQGRGMNGPLNATGLAQANALAERFAGVPLTAVVASPMVRARQTAEAVAGPHGLPISFDADWEEMHWGVFEGVEPSGETDTVFQRIVASWQAGDFSDRVDEGEPLLDVQARVLAAWHRVLDAHRGGTVAVVSHGRTLRVLLSSLLHADGLRGMPTFHHANTSVNELMVDDADAIEPVLLNCTQHLEWRMEQAG